jgi:uncharacterized protein YndB with AHSA1/START domain
MSDNKIITIESNVQKSIEDVWNLWTDPEHVKNWNNASPDWHTPSATNDLKVGGKFNYTMAAKDGSLSFDFWGTYENIEKNKLLKITLGDNRKMEVHFDDLGDSILVTEKFEAENENPIELQKTGWQAILDNFKKYAEEQK